MNLTPTASHAARTRAVKAALRKAGLTTSHVNTRTSMEASEFRTWTWIRTEVPADVEAAIRAHLPQLNEIVVAGDLVRVAVAF